MGKQDSYQIEPQSSKVSHFIIHVKSLRFPMLSIFIVQKVGRVFLYEAALLDLVLSQCSVSVFRYYTSSLPKSALSMSPKYMIRLHQVCGKKSGVKLAQLR